MPTCEAHFWYLLLLLTRIVSSLLLCLNGGFIFGSIFGVRVYIWCSVFPFPFLCFLCFLFFLHTRPSHRLPQDRPQSPAAAFLRQHRRHVTIAEDQLNLQCPAYPCTCKPRAALCAYALSAIGTRVDSVEVGAARRRTVTLPLPQGPGPGRSSGAAQVNGRKAYPVQYAQFEKH